MDKGKTKLLIIDDENQIRRFLKAGLPETEFQLIEAENAAEGIQFVATYNPEIILLDLGLPDMDGIEVVKQLREWSHTPIIVLSARGQEEDKILALDCGADDYLTKPFAIGELAARIRATIRRQANLKSQQSPGTFSAGDIAIDYAKRLVRFKNNDVHLTPLEYKLLVTLTQNCDRVMTHKQLLNEVWGKAYTDQTQYLRVMMGQLRHKLEDVPARPIHLTTEPGVGYRFRSNSLETESN